GIDAAAGATWTAAGAATSLTLISVATGRDFPMDALPAALALGAVTSVAFTTLFAAIALIGSSRAAIAAMLEPVVTVLLAAAFLDEAITARIAVGAAFVIASLPVLAASGHKETGHYEETPAPVQDGQSLE
ncbi:MAG TPA: EamA family transporter, partial [Actinomycetota bacterium]|nr:EamA family transporter [Actinomycetota bacterium]